VPPLLGFWGRLSLVNSLVMNDNWEQAVFMLFALLFIANAFLQVIRRIYFDTAQNTFDRTDKAIYISIFINLLLVLISILDPSYLLQDAEIIFQGEL
jgi:NADH:ubiquinone oxidoreductase subunit 2 (subunit N)